MEVFVYGTLTDSDRAAAVLEEFRFRGPALLSGLHRVDGRYPTLAPGGETDGRLLETADVAALDRYEGVENDLYVRVSVPLVTGATGAVYSPSPDGDGRDTVDLYVGDPQRLAAPADWPGTGPFPDRVRTSLAERDVAVRADV